jgi:hypothetical protein
VERYSQDRRKRMRSRDESLPCRRCKKDLYRRRRSGNVLAFWIVFVGLAAFWGIGIIGCSDQGDVTAGSRSRDVDGDAKAVENEAQIDLDALVQEASALAYRKFTSLAEIPAFGEKREAFVKKVRGMGKIAAKVLVERLGKSKAEGVRGFLLKCIRGTECAEVKEFLKSLDVGELEDWEMGLYGKALEDYEGDWVIDRALRILESGGEKARVIAVGVLLQRSEESATSAILRTLESDPSEYVRQRCAGIGGKPAMQGRLRELHALCIAADEDSVVSDAARCSLARVLGGSIGDMESILLVRRDWREWYEKTGRGARWDAKARKFEIDR